MNSLIGLVIVSLTFSLVGCGSNSGSTVVVESGEHDWPCFLGPGQDGISQETGIRTDWSAGNLPLLWTRELGEGYSPGSVVGDKYFHFDRDGREARLVCLDTSTGKELWEFRYVCNYRDMYNYDGGPRSSPIIHGDTVFIYGVEGELHALDISNGNVRWKHDLSERFGVHQNFFGVGSPPVVFKDKLLVMVGGSPEDNKISRGALDQAVPNGSAIVAFNLKSGDIEYQFGDDLASYSAIKAVSYEGRDWAFAWARGSLIAFDPNNGDVDFEFPWRSRMLESVNASTPVVFDGHVLLSECYAVGSVLLKFGESVDKKHQVVRKDEGRNKSLMTHWNTPIYSEGFLYASSGRHTNGATLRCVDAMTGELKWEKEGLGRCNMTLVDGHLAVVAESGQLLLVKADPTKFDLVSKYEPSPADAERVNFKYPSWAAPVIANGKMYIRGKDQVSCFELIKKD